MLSIRKDMEEFQGQLRKGAIQKAYRALLSYMMGLRMHFKNRYRSLPYRLSIRGTWI